LQPNARAKRVTEAWTRQLGNRQVRRRGDVIKNELGNALFSGGQLHEAVGDAGDNIDRISHA